MPLTEDQIKERFTVLRQVLNNAVESHELSVEKTLLLRMSGGLVDVIEGFFVDINLIAFCLNEERNREKFQPPAG